jgi:hypothetical protein
VIPAEGIGPETPSEPRGIAGKVPEDGHPEIDRKQETEHGSIAARIPKNIK